MCASPMTQMLMGMLAMLMGKVQLLMGRMQVLIQNTRFFNKKVDSQWPKS